MTNMEKMMMSQMVMMGSLLRAVSDIGIQNRLLSENTRNLIDYAIDNMLAIQGQIMKEDAKAED